MKNKNIEDKIFILLSMTYAIKIEEIQRCFLEVKSYDRLFALIEFSSENNINLERARGML